MLQTNNTGLCLQCLSHTGPAPAHSAHCSGSRLLCRELSEAGPGLHAPPWSKLLRLRHSGSSRRCGLHWACVLSPSQVRVAQVFGERSCCDLSTFPSLLFSFLGVQLAPLLRQMVTVFEDNDLLFWVPDVLCQCWEVVLWNLLSVKMFFWWICEGESGLPVLFLCHLRTALLLYFKFSIKMKKKNTLWLKQTSKLYYQNFSEGSFISTERNSLSTNMTKKAQLGVLRSG